MNHVILVFLKGWFLDNIVKPILQFADTHADRFGTQHYLFACFAIIYYGIPFLRSLEVQTQDSIFLSTIASGLAFSLIFKDIFSDRIKAFFPLYWYFVLFFSLPFLSSYMLLKGMISFQWLFFTFFLLGVLVDWIIFLILTIAGTILSVIIVGLNENIFIENIYYEDKSITSYTVVFVLVIISLFLRNRDNNINERIAAYKDLSGYIAHEMRKPLAFINTSCDGWINNSQYLFDAYEKSIQSGLLDTTISPVILNSIKKLPIEYKKTSRDGLLFIEMLLIQTQPLDKSQNFTVNSAIDTINQAIIKWECGIEKSIKINLIKDYDFEYVGNKIFMSHILLELMRNSDYFIVNNREPKVDIWCKQNCGTNEIHFRDNGQGIEKENLKKIFDYRFSTRRYGTGIGLKFCKKVMSQIDGHIAIKSEKMCFTEVILSFPPC